jgi:hypothetical protein
MVASYQTGCSCVQYLGYSEHNTLLASGGCATVLPGGLPITVKTEPAYNGAAGVGGV